MKRFSLTFVLLLSLAVSGGSQFLAAQGITSNAQTSQASPPPPSVVPEQLCVVVGRITNALTGEPIKKATVRLNTSRGAIGVGMAMDTFMTPIGNMMPARQGYSASTDNDGVFRIENVNPGEYRLSANRSGFLLGSYGAKAPNRSGAVFRLDPAQQKTDLAFSMTPQAGIVGKVLDEDGDPVSGGMVQALAPIWTRGKLRYRPTRTGQINDRGEYRIANLPPGKFYLSAQLSNNMQDTSTVPGKPDIRPVRTYYPNSVNFAGASPVEVTAGQDLSGMDIHLQSVQTYHIRGRVAGFAPDKGQEGTTINLVSRDEAITYLGGQSILRPDGSFDLAGVAPGSYYLTMFNLSGQIRSMARAAVDVGDGDVDGVILAAISPGSLKGLARLEGTPPANGPQVSASNLHLSLMPAEMMSTFAPPANAKFASDGTFTIENVMPGKFTVQASAPPGTYLKSIRFGTSEILGKELDLSGGAAGRLELIYRYGPGEIDGQLDQEHNSSVKSGLVTQIVLIPEELNADGSGAHYSGASPKGTFSILNVPPGQYRAYAFEDVNLNTLQNPEMLKQLEAKSPLFEVKENEKKQIQPTLISQDEFEQLSARFGAQPQ